MKGKACPPPPQTPLPWEGRRTRHLDLLIDKMNQKSSSIQILKSVPRVLTSDILCHEILLSDD